MKKRNQNESHKTEVLRQVLHNEQVIAGLSLGRDRGLVDCLNPIKQKTVCFGPPLMTSIQVSSDFELSIRQKASWCGRSVRRKIETQLSAYHDGQVLAQIETENNLRKVPC